MQATIQDPTSKNPIRCFDNDITAILKSKIASATKFNNISENGSYDQDSKNNRYYLDSILKIIQPFDESQQLELPSFKLSQRIRDFPSTFQRMQKAPQNDHHETQLMKREVMEIPNLNFFFEKFNGDFESDSDVVHIDECYFQTEKTDLSFLSNNHADNHHGRSKAVVDFKNFIKKANNRFESNKIYECEICKQKFDKHAALGGHMSKIHPKTSKKFQERMNVYSLRKGEREKRHFLNNL